MAVNYIDALREASVPLIIGDSGHVLKQQGFDGLSYRRGNSGNQMRWRREVPQFLQMTGSRILCYP